MSNLGFWEKKGSAGGSSAPPGNLKVDVLFTTDNSGSMSAFQNWLFDPSTAVALNDALVVNGIGAVNQDELNTDNCNRIATSKYSEMLQLAYRDLVVVELDQTISTTVGSTPTFTSSTQTFGVTVSAANSVFYTLNGTDRNGTVGGNNASVTVNVGDTLNFNLNNIVGHPFYIRDSAGGSEVSTPAATGQGSTGTSTVSWTPNTTGSYVYQCGNHGGAMVGVINVNASTTVNISGFTTYAYNNRTYISGFAPSASNVSTGGDYIDFETHKYGSGDRVVYNNGGGTSIGGLTSGNVYFVNRVNNNRFRLAETRQNAINGTGVIDITGVGSGSNHSFAGPNELTMRESSGGGSTQAIPLGASCSIGGTVIDYKRLEVPYKYYTPCDERIKYFWASNANGASFNPNTATAGNATTPRNQFVTGIQEDSYNAIYNAYAIVRDGGDDYRPRSGSKGIVVASSNQQSILNSSPFGGALPTTSGNSYDAILQILKDNNVSYVGMVGGYIASSIANRVEPYIKQTPDYGETGVPAADVRGFVPLTGAIKETGGLDFSSQTTATAGIMNSIPVGWYRNVEMRLKTANATPNRIRANIRVNMYLSATGVGGAIVVDAISRVSIGGYGYEPGDVLTVATTSNELTGLADELDITVAGSGTEDEDYTGMSNVVIGGAFTPGEFRIITIDGFTSGGGGEATDRRVRELNFATFPDTMQGETGSFNTQSIRPVTGHVSTSNAKTTSGSTAQFSSTLVLTDASAVSVGDFVYDITPSNGLLRIGYNTTVTAKSGNTLTLSNPVSNAIPDGDTDIRVGPSDRDSFGWDYEKLARETNGALYFMPGPHYWSSANTISAGSPGLSSTQATDDWQTIAIFQTWKVTFGRSIGRVFGQYLFKTA